MFFGARVASEREGIDVFPLVVTRMRNPRARNDTLHENTLVGSWKRSVVRPQDSRCVSRIVISIV